MSEYADFSALVTAYADDLYRYARWLSRDAHKAEDLVQETLLRAWRSFATLRQAGSSKAWLITILRREYFRHPLDKSTVSIDDLDTALSESELAAPMPILDDVVDAKRCLNRLPDLYREALILQIYFGYSTGEMAKLLETTESAVSNRLLRARAALAGAAANTASNVVPFRRKLS
ncbi:MAG: sigma-70 family RNA polymerase sigma factor [Burkholderiaceae bacterium]|nr:sigma-70 family RNA polymerase sigma factor [Burkholderiaceae bacterium]